MRYGTDCGDHAWQPLDTFFDGYDDLEEECIRCGQLRTVPLEVRGHTRLTRSVRVNTLRRRRPGPHARWRRLTT